MNELPDLPMTASEKEMLRGMIEWEIMTPDEKIDRILGWGIVKHRPFPTMFTYDLDKM